MSIPLYNHSISLPQYKYTYIRGAAQGHLHFTYEIDAA